MVLGREQSNERREHFRINDTLYIQYNAIDQTTAEQLGQQLTNVEHGDANQHQVQLRSLQTAFTLVTDQINHYDREVARALRILNEKINLLDQIINQPDPELPTANQKKEVNLSGGGLGLLCEQQYQERSPLSVQIELRSSGVTIQAVARVISCTRVEPENSQTPYYLRLAFTQMNEQDRDLLIKHILFRQAEELRADNKHNQA
jgi:c-di-GMP-binding flagellar brake protein YcgR